MIGKLRLAAAMAALALVAGCTAPASLPELVGETCGNKIAFFGALSGGNANVGINPRDGAGLAVAQYNAANAGCQVELVSVDSQGDPLLAPALAQKVVEDPKVLAVVGPVFSGESEAANPILDAGGVTVITPSATRPSLAEQGWKTFHRVVGSDAVQGPAAGRYIKSVLRAQRVVVIDDTSAYGKGLADEVRRVLADLVVRSAVVQPRQADFTAVVADIRSNGADAVFYGGYYAEAGPLLRRMRTAGIKATFIAGDGAKDRGLLLGAGNSAAEGAVLTCPCLPPDKAKGTFTRDFTAAFGRAPGTFSAEAFDATNILLAGIEAGNLTRASLLAFVNAYDGDGIATTYRFDSKGEIAEAAVTIWAYRVVNGEIVSDQEIVN